MGDILKKIIIILLCFMVSAILIIYSFKGAFSVVCLVSFLNPVIATSAWLMSELFLGNLQIGGANPRTIIAFVFGFYYLLLFLTHHRKLNVKRFLELILIPGILFVVGIVLNLWYHAEPGELIRWIITSGSNIATVFLFGCSLTSEKAIKRVFGVLIFLMAINSIVGILQFLNVHQAYDIRSFLGKFQVYALQGRILGMARDAIEYSYMLLLSFCLLLGFFSDKNELSIVNKVFFVISLFLIGSALILNGTRSAIGAVLFSILFWSLLGKKILYLANFNRFRKILVSLFIVSIVVLPLTKIEQIQEIFLKGNRYILQDSSALGRVARFKLGLDVFIHNPQGIGTVTYDKFIFPFWSTLGETPGISLQEFSPHNHFLRAFLHYGVIGGLLFLLYMILFCKILIVSYRNESNPFFRSTYLGCLYFFVAYCFQMIFHNAGPLRGDQLFWVLIGILLAIENVKYDQFKKASYKD